MYSKLSKDITFSLTKKEKSENGIYFSPPSTIKENIKMLESYMNNIKNILEPSCGSGEYIKYIEEMYPEKEILGIEKNTKIYSQINGKYKSEILNEDYLKFTTQKKYDLIIGNPPYFVMKKKDVNNKYHSFFEGRPNIFILFIIKSMELLNKNGIISFILPRNFLNCLYYDNMRKHIKNNYEIITIIDCDDKYLETQQETIIMIIKEGKNENQNKKFILEREEYTIFAPKNKINELNELLRDSTTMSEMNLKADVGNIVWNQKKDILTDDKTKTRLIYSSDIVKNKLLLKQYKNSQKKNYIDMPGINELVMVLNRGYGKGKYNFNYCIIDVDYNFLIENHLICIRSKNGSQVTRDIYEHLIESFNDKRTIKFVELYFGNSAINTKELTKILPIY